MGDISWVVLGPIIVAILGSVGSLVVGQELNRRLGKETIRQAGYDSDKQLNELLDKLQDTIAKNGNKILELEGNQSTDRQKMFFMERKVGEMEQRQIEYEAHINDINKAIDAEADGGVAIRARLRTKRPAPHTNGNGN